MKITVTYTLMDPTGNTTLLVETPVPEKLQPAVAEALMRQEPATEQVGFLSPHPNGISLRMAGGEFCGNAAMSTGILCLTKKARNTGELLVFVDGTEKPVAVFAELLSDASWRGVVSMPAPVSVSWGRLPENKKCPVVRFPGITHIILKENMEQKAAEALAKRLCAEFGAEALGLMFLNPEENQLKPLVYVPAANTLFWESSCASGTTACGVFMAEETGLPVQLALRQPGGTLTISAKPDGELQLSGEVRILRKVQNVFISLK